MSEREPWEIDVVSALERRIAAHGARPDFLDVVERAHALDPVAVPEEALARADALAYEQAEAEERGPADEEAVVDAWLDDVRAAVDRKVEARREHELPALQGSPTRRGMWWIVGAAVAAAALLVVGVGQAVRMVADPVEPAEQALHMNDGGGAAGTADAVQPRLHEVATPRRTPDERIEPEHAVVPERSEPGPAVEPEASEPAVEADASAAKSRTSASRSDRDRDQDRFTALAEAAQAHWRAGRRAEAQKLFAKIVAEAGRARAAEMAYADLFTLASQAEDAAAQRQWWKSYLRRFPRGRFADDARAGLCRGAAAGERAGCWQAYLDDFPHGSFRGEARVALGQGAR